MAHQDVNAQNCLKVTLFLLFITFLISFNSCKSDQFINEGQPKSEEALLAEDYIEPGIKWGYIDTKGELTIKEEFDDCRDFSYGRAAASKKGLWGYIDHTGEWRIKPVYRGAWTFQDARGRIKILDGKFGFLSVNGDLVIDAVWEDAWDFEEGFAKVTKNGRVQFIDSIGKLITEDSWDQAFSFYSGFARVSNGGWWGLLNKAGILKIKPSFDAIGELQDNRLPVQRKNLWGYCDTNGVMVIIPQYEQVTTFQQGVAAVKNDKDWLMINAEGVTLKKFEAVDVQPLGENRWSIYQNDSFALYDPYGNALSPMHYSQINKFSEGLAVFGKEGYYGYMDTSGNHVIPNLILLGWDFKNGAARYTVGEGIGFLNLSGKAYHENLFPDVRDYFEGLAKVQTVSR